MKKNKLKVLASIALIGSLGLGLASCGDDVKSTTTEPIVDPTPTPTPDPITLSSITVSGGKTDFSVGDTFSKGSLVVTAHMSDSSTKDVTSSATVSSSAVNFQTAGTYTVTVTYEGKTATYSVTVSAPTVEAVIILTEGAKVNFLLGDTFTSEGLVVKTLLSNDEEVETTDFTTELYSDSALTTKVTALANAGTYYVKVIVGNKSDKYEITVDTEKYLVANSFAFAGLADGDISQNIDLYTDSFGNSISALATESQKISVDVNNLTYLETSYTKRFKLNGTALGSGETSLNVDASGNVTNGRVVKIVATQDIIVRIVARSGSSTTERNLIFTDLGTVNEKYLTADAASHKDFEVKAGTYYVYSESGGINLYGISLITKVEASTLTYSELSVDTSKLPVSYNINTDIDLSDLVVKALNNYGINDKIDPSKFTIKDADGNAVTQFATPGMRTLTVTYGELTVTFDIKIINPDATITGIVVKEEADDLIFKKGEELSLEGLVITATDSDSLTTDVESDNAELTYKVLNGDTDVTSSFTALTKGTYTVQLTYGSQTATYNIVVLEKGTPVWTIGSTIAQNATQVDSKITVTYNDGTDTDYSSEEEEYLSTAEGYETAYYSDALCTTATTLEAALTTVGNEFYVKLSYGDFTSEAFKLTVGAVVTSQKFDATTLPTATDYKGQVLFDDSLMNVTVGSGSVKSEGKDGIANAEVQLKLDADDTGAAKYVIVTAKVSGTLTFVLNASGSDKAYTIVDGTGAVTSGTVSKGKIDNTEVEITVVAGQTYKIYAAAGGVRISAIEMEA